MLPENYQLTDDPALTDPAAAHAYLTKSYWAAGIPLATVKRAMEGSLTVVVLHEGEQVAMARIVSDYATFAYLADVYVLEAHRGKGISKAMLAFLVDHPRLQGLRRWALFTKDAQGLYEQFGFVEYPNPTRMMVRENPDVYA